MNGKISNINNKLGMNGVMKPSWNGQLYDAGNEYTDKTGGWASYAYRQTGVGVPAVAPTLTKNASNMVAVLTGTARCGSLFTGNTIDLTPFTYLKMNYTATLPTSGSAIGLGVTSNKNDLYTVLASGLVGASGSGTITVNISALNSSYYVYFIEDLESTSTISTTITKIWLE